MTKTNENLIIEEIGTYSPFLLSNLADCGSPDSKESPGAEFLLSLRREFLTAYSDGDFDRTADSDADEDKAKEVISEITWDAPTIWTHQRWLQFADLAAYEETPDDGEWSGSLTDIAGQALMQVAERLLNALLDELKEARQEDYDQDPTDGDPGDDDVPDDDEVSDDDATGTCSVCGGLDGEHTARARRGSDSAPALPAVVCMSGTDDVIRIDHADYPHHAGRLPDCPACQAACFCVPGETPCVACSEVPE